MHYAASIREKKERLQALGKQLQERSVIFSQPSCAILLAEMRWETQEIRDAEEAVRAFQWSC